MNDVSETRDPNSIYDVEGVECQYKLHCGG